MNLETSENWGFLRKVDDPYVYFNKLDANYWKPVLGVDDLDKYIYYNEIETFYTISNRSGESVAFVKIVIENDTYSVHGSIINSPIVAIKAWHFIIRYLFEREKRKYIKSQFLLSNEKAKAFLFNSGFHITHIQTIDKQAVAFVELTEGSFSGCILNFLIGNKSYIKLKKNSIQIIPITLAEKYLPEEILKKNIRYFAENSLVLFDNNLVVFCLLESFNNCHEINFFFHKEFLFIEQYSQGVEEYSNYIFNHFSLELKARITSKFTLNVPITKFNLCMLYYHFKFLGANSTHLFFGS